MCTTEVLFEDNSTEGTAPVTNWSWDFRDGTIIESEDITHTYNTAGDFSVLLTITDSAGCTDFIEGENIIRAYEQPVVEYSADTNSACDPPLTVYFTNFTSFPLDLDYYWDFGNGATSQQRDPSVTYNTEGNFDVFLYRTVRIHIGCLAAKQSLALRKVSLFQQGSFLVHYW